MFAASQCTRCAHEFSTEIINSKHLDKQHRVLHTDQYGYKYPGVNIGDAPLELNRISDFECLSVLCGARIGF